LIKAGADIDAKSSEVSGEFTPLDLAKRYHSQSEIDNFLRETIENRSLSPVASPLISDSISSQVVNQERDGSRH
jgi:hypothetical protein